MRKNELVEVVRGVILKSEPVADNAKVFHYKRAEKLVAAAFDEMLQLLAKKDPAEVESGYMKDYYNMAVTVSATNQYVELPAEIAALPGGAGVWYVKPTKSSSNYVASSQVLSSAFKSIPVSGCINDTFYRVGTSPSGAKAIIFQHMGDSTNRSVRRVDFGLVRSFDGYDEIEDIHLPDERYSFVIEKVLGWVGRPYVDLQNNGK